MADNIVIIRNPETREEREIYRAAIPFFVNENWVVLKSDGSVNPNPATTAKKD